MQEDDRGQDLPRRRTDVRKNAAQKPVGLYAEDSVQDSVVKSSSEEDETEYQVQDNVPTSFAMRLLVQTWCYWGL